MWTDVRTPLWCLACARCVGAVPGAGHFLPWRQVNRGGGGVTRAQRLWGSKTLCVTPSWGHGVAHLSTPTGCPAPRGTCVSTQDMGDHDMWVQSHRWQQTHPLVGLWGGGRACGRLLCMPPKTALKTVLPMGVGSLSKLHTCLPTLPHAVTRQAARPYPQVATHQAVPSGPHPPGRTLV